MSATECGAFVALRFLFWCFTNISTPYSLLFFTEIHIIQL